MNASDSNSAQAELQVPEESRRRFNLADGLILVAATAVAFGLIRALAAVFVRVELWPEIYRVWIADSRSKGVAVVLGMCLILLVQPCLAVWTPALVVLRWRPPRPNHRRLLREPGAMACVVGTGSVALLLVVTLIIWLITVVSHTSIGEQQFVYLLVCGPGTVGAAILWSWIGMALLGHWQPEPTWFDRVGRILGFLWILTAMAGAMFLGLGA